MSIKPPKESVIQAACLDLLRLRGLLTIRVNSGALKVGKRLVRFTDMPGCSDSLCVLPPAGRLLAIEYKQPGKKPTLLQQAFLDRVEAAGGVALVVSDVAELAAHLDRLLGGKS